MRRCHRVRDGLTTCHNERNISVNDSIQIRVRCVINARFQTWAGRQCDLIDSRRRRYLVDFVRHNVRHHLFSTGHYGRFSVQKRGQIRVRSQVRFGNELVIHALERNNGTTTKINMSNVTS